MKPSATLHIQLPPSAVDQFIPFFGSGVGIVSETGIPLMSLLCHQLGIDRQYVDQRIQTVFVNGRAVDRIDQVKLPANAVVALSAAMPGLVGAAFRKQGLLAGFRKDISHVHTLSIQDAHQQTVITLKLFNLVAKELGPGLLQRHIWVKGKILADFLQTLSTIKGSQEGTIIWNDKLLSKAEMDTFQWPEDWVALHIEYLDS